MRNCFVTASGTVDVTVFVTGLVIMVLTTVGIGLADWNGMFLDGSFTVLVMKVTVVQVINVIAVFDGGVAAVGSVLVVVIGMEVARIFAHAETKLKTRPCQNQTSDVFDAIRSLYQINP